jgi:hypothetical protein
MGKCPKCDSPVTVTGCVGVEIRPVGATPRHGVAYTCLACDTILGCEMDPLAVRSEIVSQVVEQLFQRLRK